MSESNKANQDQIEYWNGIVGEKWRAMHIETETMLRPFTNALLERAAPFSGKTLIDIGCGAGETTILAARGGAKALGIDISKPLLEVARNRTDISSESASFIEADASNYQTDINYDIAISRFGVMFFDDPTEAFANIMELMELGAEFHFVCWQDQNNNDWVNVPMRALDGLRGEDTPANPDAPGPFAFARKERIEETLKDAGYHYWNIDCLASKMPMAYGKGLEGAVEYMLRIGPASRAFAELSDDKRKIAKSRLYIELEPYLNDDTVELEGRVWLVSAGR